MATSSSYTLSSRAGLSLPEDELEPSGPRLVNATQLAGMLDWGKPEVVRSCAGRICWLDVEEPWTMLTHAALAIMNADVRREAAAELLRIALAERDRGGSIMFELLEDDRHANEVSTRRGVAYAQPVRTFIEQSFVQGLLLFIDAGLDLHAKRGPNGNCAMDLLARHPDVEAVVRAHLARQKAHEWLAEFERAPHAACTP